MIVFLGIGALFTLGRFGFPRSTRVGFLQVHRLVVQLDDLMRPRVKTFAIRAEVGGNRHLKCTTAIINISMRVLRLQVVNDIIYGRRKRHERMACFVVIGLKIIK